MKVHVNMCSTSATAQQIEKAKQVEKKSSARIKKLEAEIKKAQDSISLIKKGVKAAKAFNKKGEGTKIQNQDIGKAFTKLDIKLKSGRSPKSNSGDGIKVTSQTIVYRGKTSKFPNKKKNLPYHLTIPAKQFGKGNAPIAKAYEGWFATVDEAKKVEIPKYRTAYIKHDGYIKHRYLNVNWNAMR